MTHNLNNDIVLQKSWHGLTAKTVVRFPSVVSIRIAIANVWRDLRKIGRNECVRSEDDAGIDVRLQVHENGNWIVRVGSADYDSDHRGFWGASFVPYERTNLTDIARDLIEQAKEHCVSSGFLIYREKQ